MKNNSENPYNQVYSYEAILKELKELLLPGILKEINPVCTALIVLGILSKEDYAELIYEEIMALGYNDQDIKASVGYLMATRNPIIFQGPEKTEDTNLAFHLCGVTEDYPLQINAFEVFQKMTKDLRPHDEIIQNINPHCRPNVKKQGESC